MADDNDVELIDTKIENHELRQPHSSHEDCAVQIAELRARIAELEGAAHDHVESEEYELEEVPVV